MSFVRGALVAALVILPYAACAGGPVFDPFVETFAVGAWSDPDELGLSDGWPAALLQPAVADSVWFEAARALMRFPEDSRVDDMLAALGDEERAAAWRQAATTDLADPLADGPVTGTAGPTLAFFSSLACSDSSAAAATARGLADRPDQTQAERIVWSLRAAALAPENSPVWPAADTLLATCGPWDATNTWALVVGLRRGRGQAPVPPGAGENHGRLVGRLARNHLTADELAAVPYGPELRTALGAVSLEGRELAEHLAAHVTPPVDPELQGWWLRGMRNVAGGDAEAYEELAGRGDLLPRWRLDLWRRASERRVLAGEWAQAYDDLAAAYDVALAEGVNGSLRRRLDSWAEQALAGAVAHDREDDAQRFLDLADAHAAPENQPRLAYWRDRLEPAEVSPGQAPRDRVDLARDRYRRGASADATTATRAVRAGLERRAFARPWALWRFWGQDLVSKRGIPAARRADAEHYRTALAAADDPDACLAAALARLAGQPGVCEELCTAALAADARRLTNWASPPRPSPFPGLLARLRGSEADLHALLGSALWLGDMRGVMAIASALDGTGLTRDEKRRFLYPVPPPGPVLAALLGAANDPALLLAIARNESAFEPAVRSRAGALGFMQVMPFHYPGRGARPGKEHWSQPGPAIDRGDDLVTENRRRYGGDPYRLLAAYNAGPGATARWDRQLGGGADRAVFAAWIGYTETRSYVEKVLIDRDVYAWILSE